MTFFYRKISDSRLIICMCLSMHIILAEDGVLCLISSFCWLFSNLMYQCLITAYCNIIYILPALPVLKLKIYPACEGLLSIFLLHVQQLFLVLIIIINWLTDFHDILSWIITMPLLTGCLPLFRIPLVLANRLFYILCQILNCWFCHIQFCSLNKLWVSVTFLLVVMQGILYLPCQIFHALHLWWFCLSCIKIMFCSQALDVWHFLYSSNGRNLFICCVKYHM